MLKIARNAGATVRREGSETEAWLELPADSFASHFDELVNTHAAELDYRVKAHSRQLGRLFGFRDTGSHLASSEVIETDRDKMRQDSS